MFGIETSKDKLLQLKNNFKELKKDALNISLAEKACDDAWHLIDWVWSDEKQQDSNLTKERFRVKVYDECPEMKILHDLVNSFKHRNLTNPKVYIKETKISPGAFDSSFSKAFDVSRLEVHYGDNSRIDVDDLVEIAINYWDNLVK